MVFTFSDREITKVICILSRKTYLNITVWGVKVFGVNVSWNEFDDMSRYHGVKVAMRPVALCKCVKVSKYHGVKVESVR